MVCQRGKPRLYSRQVQPFLGEDMVVTDATSIRRQVS
jgi:hypothetical protein